MEVALSMETTTMANGDSNSKIMAQMLNAFNPSEPLEAGDRAYVDCTSVRGDEDIIRQLGNRITQANQPTCHLYTGHRGAGKSTELRRLKQYLEKETFFVVYFEADEEDIDPQNIEYVDILLACTRRLLKDLGTAKAEPIRDWLHNYYLDLGDLMSTELTLDTITLEAALPIFSKLTASIKAEPTQRATIRAKVNPHTVTLLEALNKFINSASKKLPEGKKKLAVIMDNLDRIPLIFNNNSRSNHESIFIDRADQLQQLNCHVIYTVPIALLYSKWANEVQTTYGETPILPMVMVRDASGDIVNEGIDKLKEALFKRASTARPNGEIGKTMFESQQTVEKLCLASGGHIRELMQMAQESVNLAVDLPISERFVNRAISKLRAIYQRTIEEAEWALLVHVNQTGTILNDNEHRSLLQRRCILEYRSTNGDGEVATFYRAHPLVELLPRFIDELNRP
jgi:energy-coupling factor transporter ATP-binding protein EcfA2